MARPTIDDLAAPGATLAAGVTAGFVAGVVIGGVGGRLAMLALRLTSNPGLRGLATDDGFTIGRVSAATIFLLGVTAALGMAGGLFYLVVRRWIAISWRVPAAAVFFALVGGSGLLRPGGVDFEALSPLPLAVALFVAIPAAYGAAMSALAERLLRDDSFLRRGKRLWIVGMIPLALANVVGIAIAALALCVWLIGRSAPFLLRAWRSRVTTIVGRLGLVVVTVTAGAGLLRDGVEILS